VATYWRPPPLTTIPLASVAPFQLEDQSALYPKSTNSLLDTSGAMGPDGSLSPRPFPIHLRGAIEHTVLGGAPLLPPASRVPTPRTIFLRGEAPASDFGTDDADVVVRAYALQPASEPCAVDTELPADRTDTITAMLALCQDRQASSARKSVSLSGGAWIPTLLSERTLNAPGPVEMQLAIPDDVFFFAVECRASLPATPTVAVAPSCLRVNYLGPTNQLDDTIQVPRPIPEPALSRGTFGQWTVRMTDEPAGDYLLPTFDYPFVKVKTDAGAEVPTYQFDRRPVIRFDGVARTYSLSYDLRRELAIFGAWVLVMAGLLAVWVYRRPLTATLFRRRERAAEQGDGRR
jgi:hypothetical protein